MANEKCDQCGGGGRGERGSYHRARDRPSSQGFGVVKGNRMSLLPIAQHCGQAPALSQVGAGRPAAMSSAFHAICATAPDAQAKLHRLTQDERDEIRQWHKPADVRIGDIVLTYAEAEKELEVALDTAGRYCEASDPDCLTVGHLDFAWVVTIGSERWAFIADIKRSEYTVADGPESLQLHGYAQAYAAKVGADVYVTGQWAAVEGEWWWADDPVRLDSARAVQILDEVMSAASNVGGDFALGPHCRGCYGRTRCPAYVLPPSAALAELAPFAQEGAPLTNEQAVQLKLLIDRAKDVVKYAEDELKARVAAGFVTITDKSGKVWAPVQCQGRRSLSPERIEAAGLNPQDFMKRGAPFERFQWVKKR